MPPIVAYSKADQLAVKSDLQKLPSDATIPKFLNDYSKLRDICRRIKKGRK